MLGVKILEDTKSFSDLIKRIRMLNYSSYPIRIQKLEQSPGGRVHLEVRVNNEIYIVEKRVDFKPFKGAPIRYFDAFCFDGEKYQHKEKSYSVKTKTGEVKNLNEFFPLVNQFNEV